MPLTMQISTSLPAVGITRTSRRSLTPKLLFRFCNPTNSDHASRAFSNRMRLGQCPPRDVTRPRLPRRFGRLINSPEHARRQGDVDAFGFVRQRGDVNRDQAPGPALEFTLALVFGQGLGFGYGRAVVDGYFHCAAQGWQSGASRAGQSVNLVVAAPAVIEANTA